MATDAASREFSATTKEMGDKIAALTLKEAVELSDYLEEAHGIKAAAGGMVMAAGPAAAGEAAPGAAPVKTEFDVILESFGEKKLNVIKEVRVIQAGLSLAEAKALVEGVPAKIKEGISKEDAEKIKAQLEAAGATVSIK